MAKHLRHPFRELRERFYDSLLRFSLAAVELATKGPRRAIKVERVRCPVENCQGYAPDKRKPLKACIGPDASLEGQADQP